MSERRFQLPRAEGEIWRLELEIEGLLDEQDKSLTIFSLKSMNQDRLPVITGTANNPSYSRAPTPRRGGRITVGPFIAVDGVDDRREVAARALRWLRDVDARGHILADGSILLRMEYVAELGDEISSDRTVLLEPSSYVWMAIGTDPKDIPRLRAVEV